MAFCKPFDEALYSQFDSLARRVVREIFEGTIALTIHEPESKYDVDFNVYRGGKLVGHLELEVKNDWIDDFPFPDIHFLERKAKYKNTLWVLFNRDCTRHLTVPMKRITACEKKSVPNKLDQGNTEDFFIIPLEAVTFDGLTKLINYEERQQFEV